MSDIFPYTQGGGTGWPDAGPGDDDGFVTPAVTQVVTPAVTQVVTPGAFPGPWDDGDEAPLTAGHWQPVPAQPAPPAGDMVDRAKAWLAREIEDLPGRGLIDAYRDPAPETLAGHWQHITGHPRRPDGEWASVAFLIAHAALTFPLKVTGKALMYAGQRIDLTGDRAARVISVAAFLVVLIIVARIFHVI